MGWRCILAIAPLSIVPGLGEGDRTCLDRGPDHSVLVSWRWVYRLSSRFVSSKYRSLPYTVIYADAFLVHPFTEERHGFYSPYSESLPRFLSSDIVVSCVFQIDKRLRTHPQYTILSASWYSASSLYRHALGWETRWSCSIGWRYQSFDSY